MQSGTLNEVPYTFKARFGDGKGTNPEELIAAAHAGCFTMALSAKLTEAGHPPEALDTTAKVELSIRARQLDGGRMRLDVINRAIGARSKKAPGPTHEGTGLGLANVSQRLQAHFGSRADVRFGPVPGGYEVSLAMPVDDDD